MPRYTEAPNSLERAWGTLRSEGLTAVIGKARAHLMQRRALDRQVRIDSNRVIGKLTSSGQRGLFIDCGSNLGQGFSYFERRYPLSRIDFTLVEPNPYCRDVLKTLIADRGGKITLIEAAASTEVGTALFYGLTQSYRGMCSDAGSILKDHNSLNHQASFGGEIPVRTFSLAEYINDKSNEYSSIVLKLDIEGAEYDVLEDMLAKGVASRLEAAYVEFHTEYMADPPRSRYEERERRIVAECERQGVPIRLWR